MIAIIDYGVGNIQNVKKMLLKDLGLNPLSLLIQKLFYLQAAPFCQVLVHLRMQ